jgi:Transposase DDE domain
MASIHARLRKFKDDPSTLIDPRTVESACRAAGHQWRDRVLDPLRTLQLFAAQIAHGNTAIAHLVRMAEGAFTESAYCQARARLPVAVLRAVFDEGTARAMGDCSDGSWCGHRAVLIDGTGISTPDTPELRAILGVPNGSAPGSGLPCVNVLAIFDAHRGLLLDMHAAPAHTHDLRHVCELHPALRRGDVLVGDRGLCSYVHLALLSEAGMHGVFRMPDTRGMPFPARRGERERLRYNRHRRHEPILVRLVGDDDQVVEIVKPHNRPGHVTPERFAAIPGTMIVRAVRFCVQTPGVRTRRITLLTDLTDAQAYPAADLARLYLARWRIEVNFRHLKRTLGMDRLKCRSIQGVIRELLMYALVYNTVCAVRERAAAAQRVEPFRVSFVDSLRWLLLAAGPRPTPPTLKHWPLRPPRVQPRGLKRRHSTFPILRRPRQEIIMRMIENANGAI